MTQASYVSKHSAAISTTDRDKDSYGVQRATFYLKTKLSAVFTLILQYIMFASTHLISLRIVALNNVYDLGNTDANVMKLHQPALEKLVLSLGSPGRNNFLFGLCNLVCNLFVHVVLLMHAYLFSA